jgi:Secretion system C-terminal sorting domain
MNKKIYSLILMLFIGFGAFAQPSLPALSPTKPAADVISVFSDTYTDLPGTDFFPNWGQTTVVSNLAIFGNNIKVYTNTNYEGTQFAAPINASSMTNLHLDIWTADCTAFDVYLINIPPLTQFEQKVTITPNNTGWNSIDIPLTQYPNVVLSGIGQFKFVATPSGSNLYIDNIYFWKPANVPTITGFTVPAQILGAAPFTVTDPTSTSTGAFTYTSSNTSVATISGNVITVVGVGTSTITANQAAAGAFGAGSITTPLIVSFGPPIIAAPTPTLAAANVISLFSNAYTNVAIDTWRTSWSNATLTDLQIAGNDTKLYSNLDFVGVEFIGTNVIDATTMQFYHIDVWTPNATVFRVKLVDFGANGSFGGGDDSEHEYVVPTLTLAGWNSYDIPMSAFTGLASKAHLAQMIFSALPTGSTTVYVDNVYFYNVPNAPILSNFSIPAQAVGAAPITITAPTSNSTGAFTYTSSNTSVATIVGNVITIAGGGTSTITATQAAAGGFGSGSITAPLVVTFGAPLVAAPDPTAASANVISLFSNTYTDVAGTDWFPNWGQSTVVSDTSIAGNATKKMVNLNYQGTQFATPIDLSTMQNLHIDIWTPNCTAFDLYLINIPPLAQVEQKVTLTPTTNGWNSFDIPLAQYNLINLTAVGQFKFVGTPFGSSVVYFDNVYFWKVANPPTITNFSIPAQVVGATPVTITAPTSNSTGAFSYTSSNTSVATIVGNVITIVGAGTSTITATQAAAGGFGAGSITAPLVVTFGAPLVAAPDPTAASANVISLFSNTYTDVAGTDWFPNWGQSTIVSDTSIAGNATKKMVNLNYQGTQFASPIDASTMQNLHIDIWTPNCTAFDLYLINIPPLAQVEQKVTLTPNANGWNSFDIPLAQYNLINLTAVGQYKFVGTPFGSSIVYFDNVYFWKAANTPTLTNFSIPAQLVGATPVTITAPTSNSTGAFTYTSSNTSVVTIVGNVITIVGGGTSTITATQAAAGGFGSGSITTSLVVSFAVPMIAAPVPTALSTNVFSLFSDGYSNLAGIDWFPNWGQSTVATDITIAGNTTRKYDNLNYQGVEFATPINVSGFSKLHLDVWTPNCTAFQVFLINIAPAPFVQQSVTLTPTLNGWNSYDIVLASSFRNPTTVVDLTKVGQMKFEAVPFGGSIVYVDNIYFFNSSVVPVTLTNFTATKNKNISNINWNTLTETGNKGFEVERSNDGRNFTSLEFVPSQGNTKNNYTTIDKAPKVGVNYYRLKQIDVDGRFTYSSIVSVKFDKEDIASFTFYPNPAKEILKINVGVIETENATIKLMNTVGQTVISKTINKSASTSVINFDVSKMASGIYYLELKNGTNSSIEKVIIN